MINRSNRISELMNFDLAFLNEKKLIAGIDEAGRGAIAGPVFAAAVILNYNLSFNEIIDDSKLLSPEQRKKALLNIEKNCMSIGFASECNNVIDEINILQATMKSMQNAVSKLEIKPDFLLIDGNYYRNNSIPYKTVVDGDAKSLSIAAASIVAKVQRDKFMIETAHKLYPEYGFDLHKGYGTRRHYEAITKHGICPLHRKSFLKKIINHKTADLLFKDSS